jgi:hypothetical protein
MKGRPESSAMGWLVPDASSLMQNMLVLGQVGTLLP